MRLAFAALLVLLACAAPAGAAAPPLRELGSFEEPMRAAGAGLVAAVTDDGVVAVAPGGGERFERAAADGCFPASVGSRFELVLC